MQEIDKKFLDKLEKEFKKDKSNLIITNAVAKNGIKNASFNNDVLRIHNNIFSNEVKGGSITNQKSSGRCWIFASLNMVRIEAMKKLKVEDLELSQSYIYFFDKIEKTNTFLENIITHGLKLDYNDALFKYLMDGPADDGGFWEWFLGLINKYGIVPKYMMPDTNDAQSSHEFLELLNTNAKDYAAKIREASEKGAKESKLRDIKKEAIAQVYAICAKVLGIPPKKFDFEYQDKDKKFHKEENLTPKKFFDKYVGKTLESKVNLVSDPRSKHPYGKVLTSEYFNSVFEAKNNLQLNVPMDEMIKATVASIKDGISVPFACDVSKYHDTKTGIMDMNVFDYDNTIAKIELDRVQRLNYHASMPTHLMNIVGVDLDKDGNVIKWKVENSWGEKMAFKGFFSMSDEWFREYNYQVVVDKKYVDAKYLKGLDEKPVILEPGDPLAYLH